MEPAPQARPKAKQGLTAAQIKAQEEAEERKRFYENLKNSRGGQKPFTDEDLKMFKVSDEYAQDVPVPYPFLNDEGNRGYIMDRYNKKPPRDGIIPADKKMVVTEYSLDHWLAQSFKLNLESIPPVRPSHIPRSVYEQLKKYIKYGNVNYDAQQQQQATKKSRSSKRPEDNHAGKTNNGSQGGMQQSNNEQQQTHNRPNKYTIIVYPKTMKVKPVVDIIEEKYGYASTATAVNHLEALRTSKDLANLETSDDFRMGEDSPTKQVSRHASISRTAANRSRNHNNNSRTGMQSSIGVSSQTRKMIKLPNYKLYQRPNRGIRNRIYSNNLDFLNPIEIEFSATNYDKYLQNLKNINSQQQSYADINQILQDTTSSKSPKNRGQDEKKEESSVMQRRLANINNRRSSKNNNKMFLKQFYGNSAQTFSKDKRNSINDFSSHTATKIFGQQDAFDNGKSPYVNIGSSTSQIGEFSNHRGSLLQKFSSPTSSFSPLAQDSPRTQFLRSAGGSRIQKHLEQIKLTSIKTKLKAFREEKDINQRNEQSQKLGILVNRNLFNQQVTTTQPLLQLQNSSPLSESKIEKSQTKPPRRASVFGEGFMNQFSSTATKLTTHLFPAHKSVTSKLLKTLETTNITEILEDKNIVLTPEEKATLSQRNHQRISNIITNHLEDEIEESRNGQRDNISINMSDITMDFNELQKRINDMNNPVFWLQKAIQKQRIPSVVAIEGAIDYYKQGLRITPQSEQLLYNIACSYEKIGKYENAIRWFQHVIEITPKHADSLFGLALSNFKLTRYSVALPFIEKAIEYWNNKCLTNYNNMIYFRSLCFKKTGDKHKCLRDYESLRKIFIKNLNQSLVSYVFGIILMPLQEERKLITNFIENFNELLIFYKNQAPLHHDNRVYISQFCLTKKQEKPWRFDFQKYKHYIYYYLSKKSFFKRVPKLQIFSQELEEALVCRYSKNELVLIPQGYVGVILVGTIFVLSHAELDIMKPRLLFKGVEGQIIGNEESDNGASSHSETWLLSYENSEVIFLKKDSFQKIWDNQRMNTNRQIILSSIQKNLVFSSLTMQLKYFLIYEKLQERIYQPGEIVVYQSKRSSMNKHYRPLFENRVSRLRVEIENKKQSTEMNTGKRQTEIGSLMSLMKETNHIKKMVITQSTTAFFQQRKDESEHQSTSRGKNSGHQKQGSTHDHYDTLPDSDCRGNDSKVNLLFENPQESSNSLLPQCADQDEEFLGKPYCQGIYILQSGSINLTYENDVCYTLKNGDSFGESVIIKKPSYEYFGNLVAGPQGAKCYLFTYDVLRGIPFKTIIDIIEVGGFMRKKEGLMHTLQQKYGIDIKELTQY